jgi:hypothetical protein
MFWAAPHPHCWAPCTRTQCLTAHLAGPSGGCTSALSLPLASRVLEFALSVFSVCSCARHAACTHGAQGIAEGSHSGMLMCAGVRRPCAVAERVSAWSACADLHSNSMDLRKKSVRAVAASAGRCCGTEDALCGDGGSVRVCCGARLVCSAAASRTCGNHRERSRAECGAVSCCGILAHYRRARRACATIGGPARW